MDETKMETLSEEDLKLITGGAVIQDGVSYSCAANIADFSSIIWELGNNCGRHSPKGTGNILKCCISCKNLTSSQAPAPPSTTIENGNDTVKTHL